MLIVALREDLDIIRVDLQMNESNSGNQQPIVGSDQPFIVNVKLLSNEVYEIQARSSMPVSDFKKKIEGKIGVPVDKQRLVFSGKQLLDNSPINQYVKESGLTVHLIAKSAATQPAQNSSANTNNPQPQQSQPQQPQQSQPQQSAQNQQLPFPPLPGPLNFGNMFSSIFGGRPNTQSPQQINEGLSQAFGNMGNLGNIQIRMVSGPPLSQSVPQSQGSGMQQSQTSGFSASQPINIQTQSQQFQPQLSQPQQSQPQQNQNQQGSGSGQGSFTINQGPLVQLQTTINRLNLPSQQLPAHVNPRDQTIMYLRRLQSEMLRFIPHLNRSIQLMQEGRVTHLPDLIPIFHSLNFANSGAVDVIQRYLSLHHQQNQHHHYIHRPNENQNEPQGEQTGNPGNRQQPNQNQQQQSNNPFELLGGLTGPNSGFNFANLFRPQQQPHNNQTPNSQPNTQQEREKPGKDPRSIPQPEPENVGSRNQSSGSNTASALTGNNPQSIPQPESFSTTNQTQPNTSNPVSSSKAGNDPRSIPQPEPLDTGALRQQLNSIVIPVSQGNQGGQAVGEGAQGGGVNLMGMFSSLQQNGGIGELLSMSLGDMVDEGQMEPVYRDVFKVISGGEIIGMFTSKNFSFLSTKRAEFREAFLKAIASAGSREQLVIRYSQDLCALLVPETQIKNKDQCKKRLEKISSGHIQKIIGIFLEAPASVNSEVEVLGSMKLLYCESMDQISKHTESIQSVFQHLKANTVKFLDKYAPGLSGLFYSIIERDLIRVYKEYDEEKKRKQERTEEEAQDETELLRQIEEESAKDVDFMASFEHSKYYPARE